MPWRVGQWFQNSFCFIQKRIGFPTEEPPLSLQDKINDFVFLEHIYFVRARVSGTHILRESTCLWNTYTSWERVPKRHWLTISLSRCENVWRKPNSKSELGSHGGGAVTWASLVTACIVQQEEGRCPCGWATASGSRCLATAREKLPPLELFQWTSVQNSPSQIPSFLYKRMLSSFVLQTCLWFAIVCLSWIAISLLFRINSILLAELLLFLFQNVDNVNNLNSVLKGKV